MKNHHKLAIVVAVSVGFVAAVKPASANLIWDWSYSNNYGSKYEVISGTFVTDGTTPKAFTPYTILDITGTVRLGSTLTDTITNLVPLPSPFNTFEWNGTSTSPLYVNGYGLDFNTQSGRVLYVSNYSGQPYYYAPAYYEGGLSFVDTSSLVPESTPSSVPEPTATWGLLALGAMGAGSMLKRQQLQKAAKNYSIMPVQRI